MLKLAFLPLYQRWKTATLVRSILRGFNAAAVGLVSPSLTLHSPLSPPRDMNAPAVFSKLTLSSFADLLGSVPSLPSRVHRSCSPLFDLSWRNIDIP
jgi:hypothetical protein